MGNVSQSTTRDEGTLFLDGLYDATAQNGSQALQFRIFDVQLSGCLPEDWLKGALTDKRTSVDEADCMIREDLLRVRTKLTVCRHLVEVPPGSTATTSRQA